MAGLFDRQENRIALAVAYAYLDFYCGGWRQAIADQEPDRGYTDSPRSHTRIDWIDRRIARYDRDRIRQDGGGRFRNSKSFRRRLHERSQPVAQQSHLFTPLGRAVSGDGIAVLVQKQSERTAVHQL